MNITGSIEGERIKVLGYEVCLPHPFADSLFYFFLDKGVNLRRRFTPNGEGTQKAANALCAQYSIPELPPSVWTAWNSLFTVGAKVGYQISNLRNDFLLLGAIPGVDKRGGGTPRSSCYGEGQEWQDAPETLASHFYNDEVETFVIFLLADSTIVARCWGIKQLNTNFVFLSNGYYGRDYKGRKNLKTFLRAYNEGTGNDYVCDRIAPPSWPIYVNDDTIFCWPKNENHPIVEDLSILLTSGYCLECGNSSDSSHNFYHALCSECRPSNTCSECGSEDHPCSTCGAMHCGCDSTHCEGCDHILCGDHGTYVECCGGMRCSDCMEDHNTCERCEQVTCSDMEMVILHNRTEEAWCESCRNLRAETCDYCNGGCYESFPSGSHQSIVCSECTDCEEHTADWDSWLCELLTPWCQHVAYQEERRSLTMASLEAHSEDIFALCVF